MGQYRFTDVSNLTEVFHFCIYSRMANSEEFICNSIKMKMVKRYGCWRTIFITLFKFLLYLRLGQINTLHFTLKNKLRSYLYLTGHKNHLFYTLHSSFFFLLLFFQTQALAYQIMLNSECNSSTTKFYIE